MKLALCSLPATYQGVEPYFIRTPANRVAVEGNSVMLYCGANGRDVQGTPPSITWLKDGVTVYGFLSFSHDLDHVLECTDHNACIWLSCSELGNRFSLVGSGSLRIDSVQEEDAGSYTCRATNMEDSIDAVAMLTVHGESPHYLTC